MAQTKPVPQKATVNFETGVYKHLNGKTFKVAQVLANGAYALIVPKATGGSVLVDFPGKNLDLM